MARSKRKQHEQGRSRQSKARAGGVAAVRISEAQVAVWLPESMSPSRIAKSYESVLGALLAESAPKRLLEVGADVGLVGLAAAQHGWADEVVLLMRDAVGANIVSRTLEAKPAANAQLIVGEGPLDAPEGAYDIVVVHQQQSRRLTEMLIRQAITRLAPDGELVVGGDVQGGVRTSERLLDELFGEIEAALGAKNGRVIIGKNPRTEAAMATRAERIEHVFDVAEEPFRWVTAPGVFSVDGLDPASELLLETLVLPRKGRILDLGCGPGVLGLFAASRKPGTEVTMLDADVASVACAQEGIRLNGLTNARVLLSDGIEAVRGERFDVVLTNPPAHRAGRREAGLVDRFAREAAQAVGRKGRLWLVTAPTVPIAQTLQELYTEIAVTDDFDGRFRLYDAIRRPARAHDRDSVISMGGDDETFVELDGDMW